MIPLRDNLKRRARPQATHIILFGTSILSGTFLAVGAPLASLFKKLSFVPHEFTSSPWSGFLTMITASFLHGNLLHLIGNMLFLFVYAPSVEALLGMRTFLLIYPFISCTGFLLHWVRNPTSDVPVIGASVAISAIMGFYLAALPRAKIMTFVTLGWFIKFFFLPAWVMLIPWVLVQLISVGFGFEASDAVAYTAHIGGFVLGFISGIAWKSIAINSEGRVSEIMPEES